jgi:hypothetical protein
VEDLGMRGTTSFWGKRVLETKEIFLVPQINFRKALKHSKNAAGEFLMHGLWKKDFQNGFAKNQLTKF